MKLYNMEESKILVVIGVLSVILIGIAVYLFILDKKVKSMEDKLEEIKKSKK